MRHAPFALLIAAVLAACSRPEPAPEPVRAVRTLTVQPQSTDGVQEFAGEVRARTESRLGFRIGGKMVRRDANLGDAVKAGQVLAQLDPQDLRLGQDAARAAVAAAEVTYQQQAADFKRYQDLRNQNFISAADLERRESTLKSAKAQWDQARAQLNMQGNQAAYAALIADASGVITAVDAEPGAVVAAGTPVLKLAHDGPRDVVFAVAEDKVGLIKSLADEPGRFTVRLWGDAGKALPVSVREIAAAADPVTRTFQVKATIGESPGASAVRLGQTATVQLRLPQASGVTRLPMSALRQEQGHTSVWLVEPASMTLRSQPVTLSGADGNDAVITAGLAPGNVVVTAGVHVLSPGQKVKFYVDPAAPAANAASAPLATRVTVQ